MAFASVNATPLLTAFRTARLARERAIIVGSGFRNFLLVLGWMIPLSVCWYLVSVEPLFEVGSVDFTHPDVVAEIVVIAVLARALIKGFHPLPRALFVPLLLFFLSTLVSTIFAADKLRAAAALIQEVEFAALAWAFSLIGDAKIFRRIMHFILAIFVAESLVATWQFIVLDMDMPTGTFQVHQQYAFYTTCAAAMTFALLILEKVRWKKLLYLATLFILLMGSALGLERAPWIALVFSGVAVTAYSGRRKKAVLIGFAAAVLGAVLLVVSVPRLREATVSRLMEAQKQSAAENSLLSRLLLWRVGLQLFLDHPIIGIGPKNFVSLVPHYLGTDEMMGAEARSAHNVWVQVLAEQGIIGIVSYVTLCWAILKLGTVSLQQPISPLVRSTCLAYLAYTVFWIVMSMPYFMKGEGHVHFMIIGLMAGITSKFDGGKLLPSAASL
jgi:O-antigen ligase